MLQKRPWCFPKRAWCFKKTSKSFLKRSLCFQKSSASFLKSSVCFSCRGRLHHPLIKPIILLFRSSLHFNHNIHIINLLRMTAHPLILPSAVLSKSLHIPLCTFYTSFQPAPTSKMQETWQYDWNVYLFLIKTMVCPLLTKKNHW